MSPKLSAPSNMPLGFVPHMEPHCARVTARIYEDRATRSAVREPSAQNPNSGGLYLGKVPSELPFVPRSPRYGQIVLAHNEPKMGLGVGKMAPTGRNWPMVLPMPGPRQWGQTDRREPTGASVDFRAQTDIHLMVLHRGTHPPRSFSCARDTEIGSPIGPPACLLLAAC